LAWIAAIAGGVIAAVIHLVLQERPRALALDEG
jgi:hypothetical protein